MDRFANGLGSIEEYIQFYRLRNLRPKLWQNRLDRIDNLYHVRTGLPLNAENDRSFVVKPAPDLSVFYAIDRGSDVLNPYRGAVPVGYDHRQIGRCVSKLAFRHQRVCARGSVWR